MNIWYTSSDKCAPHLGVSMLSLMENNKELDHIRFFVSDEDISELNKKRIQEICDKYGRELVFLDSHILDETGKQLKLKQFRGSYVMYGKMFPDVVLPADVHNILFIDAGDTVVSGSLKGLESFDFEGKVLGVVPATDAHAAAEGGYADHLFDIQIAKQKMYFNCGVLWMNIDRWREVGLTEIIKAGVSNDPHYDLADQTPMNQFIPSEYVKKMDLRYNFNGFALAPKVMVKRLQAGGFYSEEEVMEAARNPIVIHWPGSTAHPYVKGALCRKKEEYLKYRAMSPWSTEPLTEKLSDCLPKAQDSSFKAKLMRYMPVVDYYFPRG